MHSPIALPDCPLPVFDFTEGYDPEAIEAAGWGIGRYDEVRATEMYDGPIYTDGRRLHMGVDVWAPAGTPVVAVQDGIIHSAVDHAGRRNYGPTIITRHTMDEAPLWILYGHLSRDSLRPWAPGAPVTGGETLGRLGTEAENGGWVPHLHIQLSRTEPENGDLPGVVHPSDRPAALATYPDPRRILGSVYSGDGPWTPDGLDVPEARKEHNGQ